MKIKYLTTCERDDLKANIRGNINHYESDEPWLTEFFGKPNWARESSYHMPDDLELVTPQGGDKHFDTENTKIIYSALKELPLSVAIDERFWVYLSHVTFWKYMRKRWPIENGKKSSEGPAGYIRERYFFMPNRDRSLIRNGISRLWWYGYLTYDENRSNPFELTEALLEKLDIAQQLLERSYSRNTMITRTILSMLVEKKKAGIPFSHREKQFRPLVMHLNALGGVTILDALDEQDIRATVESKLEQLQATIPQEETGIELEEV